MSLKRFVLLPVMAFILFACTGNRVEEASSTAPSVTVVEPSVPAPTPANTPSSSQPLPTATTITPIQNDNPSGDLALTQANIQLYPVPQIYAGDQVTFQIHPFVPASVDVNAVTVSVYVDNEHVITDVLSHRNWAGQAEGLYAWAWDSTNAIGSHLVRVEVDPHDMIQAGDENPANNVVEFSVDVGSSKNLPKAVKTAVWEITETDCCTLYTLTGTAAHRDIYTLRETVETAVSQAANKLDEYPARKINIYFIERTIGQGGFAGSDMVITYNDRKYTGGNLHELIVHESVHIIDRQFAPQRIKFLAEGLAVWASGGHYKPENLSERTAALIQLGEYIPLQMLVDDFYPVQHEIGYLEAAGFVTYLVDIYGYSTFRELYSETGSDDAATEYEALDLNLREYYGKSLAEMEAEWLAYLNGITVSETAVNDLATTIRFYNTMRQYQQQYDPTAHFLTAWLPPPREVRETGNSADFIRHPQSDANITLELMLASAEEALQATNFARANVLLDSIDRILATNSFVDPLATSYWEIVVKATGLGYEIQTLDFEGDTAVALVNTANKPTLNPLQFKLKPLGWVLTN